MAGTKVGGLKAAATNKAKYGKNFMPGLVLKVVAMGILVVLPATRNWRGLLAVEVAGIGGLNKN